MKYIGIINQTDGLGNLHVSMHNIDASDARTAHAALQTMPNSLYQTVSMRVYPDTSEAIGLQRGAIMVARRTAANAIKREGSPEAYIRDMQWTAINARLNGCDDASRVNAVLADYSHDVQDMYSVSMVGLYEGHGLPIDEQYSKAYKALNAHLHALKSASIRELSIEYLRDGNHDLVPLGNAIAYILKGDARWIPAGDDDGDNSDNLHIDDVINRASAGLSARQQRILRLLVMGYSQRQIADAIGIDVAGVNRNISTIRNKMTDYINDNAPEIISHIYSDRVSAAVDARKKAAAERAKAYRARKKAAMQD